MKEFTGGKGCLFVAAVAVGTSAAVVIYGASRRAIAAALIGFGLALLYTVLAAWAVGVCEALRTLAFPGNTGAWSIEVRTYLGACWPLSILFWIVITPFFAIINRLFR